MEIPTNDDGMFEAVDGDGVVAGHGIVLADPPMVDFAYTDGVQEHRVLMDREQFDLLWGALPPLRALTLRAAA